MELFYDPLIDLVIGNVDCATEELNTAAIIKLMSEIIPS